MGSSPSFIYAFFFSLFYYFPCFITAQQPYLPNVCRRNDNIDPLSVLGYSCNGVNKSCQSFLIYRTQPPYNTIHSIASLLSANASQISAINNNITEHMALATNTEVIVPVTCSCSGRVYQANTTHIVKIDDNYYTLANNTFEGLTTCKAIRLQKVSPNVVDIFPPERLTIPLRCACPTTRQVNKGIRYLMTFVVQQGNDISSIAIKFGADVGLTLEANKKSEQDPVIQPFTTLLVPLHDPPNGSQMQYSPYVPPSTSPLPSLPPTATPPSPQSSNWNSSLVVGAAFVLVVVFILLFMLPRTVMRKEKSQSIEAEEKALVKKSLANETESQEFLENISRIASVKVYTFRDLQAATEDFNSDHWIKGSIYKGNINGDVVAIKKIDGDVSREISVLNKINHFNLIRLLGVCFDHETWYCVYEYAGNGPLCDWIFQDNPNGKSLSWGKRMQVAFDVATGLNYLHSYTSPPLVHKDIQSNNVFLNNEFRAKIAKFGLSRSIRGNNGQFTLTKHIEGRKGYLAPEYLENGVVSPMLDVYAFGVLLLEMLTGKDVALLYEGVKVHLSEVLNPVLSDKDGFSNVKDFIDTSLGEDYPADIAYTMLVLIDRCLRKDPGSPQHPYGDENCPDYNNATSALGYDCNGANTTCQSFLIYRTQPPYNTISSIASLLSANATQMSAISNNISENMALATNTQVIVPVTCSCSGRFYQANATYVVEIDDNPYVITNNVFRGLTTCNAIQTQKTNPNLINVFPDESLTIPLRCACPTTSQFNEGIRYLMSFVIQPGNAIASIANKFRANLEQTFEANEKSEPDEVIQPFTTLLVPLRNPPNGSVMKYPAYVPPPLSSPPSLPPTVIPSPPSSRGSSDRILKSHSLVSSQSFEAQENACTEPSSETDTRSLDFLDSISKIASMKVHSFKDLQAATNNFSTDHWIKVLMYKGNLNGNEVAIKKMDGNVSKEISVLNKMKHFNLVKLLGVCFEDGVWYFVYEYAENGALSDWIYQDNPDKRSLSWGKRMQVACDIATGLNYLHSYTSPPHVHKDIKSSNIFLDQEFRAKIAKFGFSRPVKGNDGRFTLTKHIEGTKGYLAPEYLENGIVSPMLDVYAFDVLLIEMLSGKDVSRLYEGVQLSEILGPVLSEEGGIISMKEFIDSSLGKDYPTDVAYTMLMLIDRCLSKEP
ncbi:LysM domain receptor-like kinase 4 [Bienertia sinuspersici]